MHHAYVRKTHMYVIFLHPVARSIIQSFSSVFVRQIHNTEEHIKADKKIREVILSYNRQPLEKREHSNFLELQF
jgi:hypothetical protein